MGNVGSELTNFVKWVAGTRLAGSERQSTRTPRQMRLRGTPARGRHQSNKVYFKLTSTAAAALAVTVD